MIDEEPIYKDCKSLREYLNLLLEGEALAPEENFSCIEHLKQCLKCHSWYSSHQSIMSFAKGLPSFDVQEQLTQKILSRINMETRTANNGGTIAAFLLILGGLMFLYWQHYDTVFGFGSWSVGILFMFLLKHVVSEISSTNSKAEL